MSVRLIAGLLALLFAFSAHAAFNGFNASNPNGGWTPLTPAADSNLFFVSSSTGNDSTGNGTAATPWATIGKVLSGASGGSLSRALTSGKPDYILLKCGDTFVENLLNFGTFTGGRSSTEPAVMTSYSSGALNSFCSPRPLIDSGDQSGFHYASATFNFFSFVNFELSATKRDPTSANFSIASTALSPDGFDMTTVTSQYLLWEGLYIHNYRVNITLENNTTGRVVDHWSIRRTISTDTYVGTSAGHSQSIFLTDNTNLLVEQNVFDNCGWNATLSAPATGVSINTGTGVITWPNIYVPQNTATVTPSSSGGGVTAGTNYFVVNLSGSTFQISLTVGGAPISISAGFSTTWKWLDVARNNFDHCAYIHEDDDSGSSTVSGNIITRASNVGVQQRRGGITDNNYFGDDPISATTGNNEAVTNAITNNVSTQGTSGNNIPEGFQIVANSNGAQVTKNIIAHSQNVGASGFSFASNGSLLSAASWAATAGGQATFTFTDANYGLTGANIPVAVGGVTPSGYNGTSYVTVSAAFPTVVVPLVSNPGAGTVFGEISSSINTNLANNVAFGMNGTPFLASNPPDLTTIGTSSTNGNQSEVCAGCSDTTRDAGPYNASLGGTNSLAAFIANARANSKASWNTAYTAGAVNNYIRAGFGMAAYP